MCVLMIGHGGRSRVLSFVMFLHQPSSGDREPGFGLTLCLVSGLGVIAGLAALVMVGWQIGLIIVAGIALALWGFLRWELRRLEARRREAAQRRRPGLAISGSRSL